MTNVVLFCLVRVEVETLVRVEAFVIEHLVFLVSLLVTDIDDILLSRSMAESQVVTDDLIPVVDLHGWLVVVRQNVVTVVIGEGLLGQSHLLREELVSVDDVGSGRVTIALLDVIVPLVVVGEDIARNGFWLVFFWLPMKAFLELTLDMGPDVDLWLRLRLFVIFWLYFWLRFRSKSWVVFVNYNF